MAALTVTPSTRNGMACTAMATKIVAQCATAGWSRGRSSSGRRAAAASDHQDDDRDDQRRPARCSCRHAALGGVAAARRPDRCHSAGPCTRSVRTLVTDEPAVAGDDVASISAVRPAGSHEGRPNNHGEELQSRNVGMDDCGLPRSQTTVVLAAPLTSPKRAAASGTISGARRSPTRCR